MKKLVKISMIGILALNFAGCSNDAIYKDEHYKNLVYLLSGTDNIYVTSYTLNEEESDRYVTVGCGGSNSNNKNIEVNLQLAPEWIDRYNNLNFDYEYQYTKMLSANRYNISSYSITVPAKSDYHYERLPVRVRPLGLSPDSIYFIPLKIVSVSEYEVNEDKQYVLFRVTIENDYATQVPQTSYIKSGYIDDLPLSGSKIVHPLTKDKVRMLVGYETYTDATTPAFINRNAVVVQVNANNSVTITPYDVSMMEVEMLNNVENLTNFNLYNPALMQGNTKQRVFWLNYRFRQRTVAGGAFGAWQKVEEKLIREEK